MLRTSPARLWCDLLGFLFLNLAIAILFDPCISKSAITKHVSSVAFAHAGPQRTSQRSTAFLTVHMSGTAKFAGPFSVLTCLPILQVQSQLVF